MKREIPFYGILLSYIFISFSSCQKDRFEDPQIEPNTISTSISDIANLTFSQTASTSDKPTPYTNIVVAQVLDKDIESLRTIIYSFKDSSIAFNNLNFSKDAILSFTDGDTDTIALQETNNLFAKDNLLVLATEVDENDHAFSGMYDGELNLFSDQDSTQFVGSYLATGTVSHSGEFFIFNKDEEEPNIKFIKGNFNVNNLVTGSIRKQDNSVFSTLQNLQGDNKAVLTDSSLKATYRFTDANSQPVRLEINLTKQD